jgi:hypothetical protein
MLNVKGPQLPGRIGGLHASANTGSITYANDIRLVFFGPSTPDTGKDDFYSEFTC